MPRRLIWSAIPVLPYADVEATLDFYGKLGFALVYTGVDYMTMQRDGLEVHFARAGAHSVGSATTCYLRTPDVDNLRAELVESLQGDVPPVAEMPWRMRELHIVDPYRNLLRFAQPSTE
ncbi:MAG: VOC family protein [Beijerinckiaceae bacterium]|jgi:hypothetical protein|nr:VOC family protein [Beijerinckiaceae bacterium]MDO9439455.1 VOC family protein [Beijerinckiaceae bacterium]